MVFKIDRIENVKIGIFDPYLDDLGGGEKYMLTIASCLSQKGKIDIFWDNRDDIKEVLRRFHIDLSKIEIKENIFAKNVSLFKRLWVSKFYDIIIVLSDGSLPLLLCKNLFIHFQSPLPHRTVTLKTRIKQLRIKKILCNSYFTKSFIDKIYAVDSKVLYPPITVADRKNKKVKKENIILHVGRFRVKNVNVGDYKKQSVMVDAFKKMVNNGLFGWKLVIAVGLKNEDKEEFNKMVKSAKNFPVEFSINQSNEELLELYSKAKIYWHATGFGEDLRKHPEYAEHFGISTVEAMAGGVVPVVINVGGQKEIVEDGKNGFLWNTLDELIVFTKRLIDNENLMIKMSGEATIRSKIFAGDRFCRELNAILFTSV